MTITAKVAKRAPTIGVSVSNTGKIESTTPVTIQTNATKNRLDQLVDVVEQNPQEGQTLVYDAETDRYVVKYLTMDDLGSLDGGTF